MCTGNREDSQSISKYVHGQVSQYTQFLNVTEIGPDAYGIKSGRVPIYKAARVCSAPTHMGVCCVEIGDEMVPLKRERCVCLCGLN